MSKEWHARGRKGEPPCCTPMNCKRAKIKSHFLALLEGARMPQAKSAKITPSTMEYAVQPYEVQVSGSQVLIGLVSALGSLSLFLLVLRGMTCASRGLSFRN